MTPLLAILSLGLFLGMRHATDSDHVVAVTTIVSQQRSVRFAGLVGAAWGVGHTVTLLLVGGAVILFSIAIPPWLGLGLEFAVAVMLVVLGSASLLTAVRAVAPPAPHAHDDSRGAGSSRAIPLLRPLVVGIVHGLAGSAAVALLVLTTIHDPRWALLYLLLFGVGTVLGMILVTSAIAVPFALAADRFAHFNQRMVQATSLLSIGLGIFLAYKIGVVDGLFASSPHWTPQ